MSIAYVGQSHAKSGQSDKHRAAIKNIPPESIRGFMTLVAGPPTGGYYRTL